MRTNTHNPKRLYICPFIYVAHVKKERRRGEVYLFFQLGLGQKLWDEVQTDMDGGDARHSQRQQSLRVTLTERESRREYKNWIKLEKKNGGYKNIF